jgi:hypothetical protein
MTVYLPARPRVIIQQSAELRQIKFDPKHTSLAQIEIIIKNQTGYAVHLNQGSVRVTRLKSKDDMMMHFARAMEDLKSNRLALNR